MWIPHLPTIIWTRFRKPRLQISDWPYFFWGVFFGGRGFQLSLPARQPAPPPPKHGPGPRGLRAHTVSTHPQLVRPPHPSAALVAGVPVGATHVAAVPGPAGTPGAVCVEASSTRPTGVRPAAGLRRCVRRTSRLGLFPPGQSALQPTKEDLCLRPPDCGSPALPQVEHLYSDCRLAVFDQISIRHLVRPPFRHTSEERAPRGRAPAPPRTDQRPTA